MVCGVQADTSGSMEAVKATVQALPSTAIMPRFLMAAANEINTSDVDLAYNSQAIILGFNVEPSEAVIAAAKQKRAPFLCACMALNGSLCTPCLCHIDMLRTATSSSPL